MTWRPLHSRNAIERVRLTVQFTEPVPAKISRQMAASIQKTQSETRMQGPTPVSTTSFNVMVDPSGAPQVAPQAALPPGWKFERFASNNVPVEACVFDGATFIYESSDYHRWSAMVQRVRKVAQDALQRASDALTFGLISLEYIDRFIFEGRATDAAIPGIFPGLENVLSSEAIEGRQLWHLHRGWYETSGEAILLVNQNMDAQDGQVLGREEPARSLQLTTRADLRSPHNSLEMAGWDSNLDLLHQTTDLHFKKVLSPHLHASVGISS